jgi:hypothetical protein
MLRLAMRLRVRPLSILLAALLTLALMATSALAQVGDICPVGTCGPGGGSIPGDGDSGGDADADPPDDDVDIPGGAGGGSGPPARPGQPGSDAFSSGSGSDGADSDQGAPGRPGVGQPGRSGNPSPTPAVRTPTSPGGRTIPSYPQPRAGSRTTAQTAQASGAELLPFEVIPSPFPTLEPSPSPSPSPSPTDLVAAIDNLDPEPVAEEGGSLIPLFAVLAGAALLFVYFRSRKRTGRAGRVSGARYR